MARDRNQAELAVAFSFQLSAFSFQQSAVSSQQLAGKRVGVGGHPTTGRTLAVMFGPSFELVGMPYDEIADAVCRGDLDAGVMIHEELLHFPKLGLIKVLDLGQARADADGTLSYRALSDSAHLFAGHIKRLDGAAKLVGILMPHAPAPPSWACSPPAKPLP